MELVICQIQKIRSYIYANNKHFQVQVCEKHNLPNNLSCLQQKCQKCFLLICQQCSKQSHNKHLQYIIQINQIIPRLQKYLDTVWQNIIIQDSNIKIANNKIKEGLQYCIKFITKLRDEYLNESILKGIDRWNQIICCVSSWLNNEFDSYKFMRDFKEFYFQYGMGFKNGSQIFEFKQAKQQRKQQVQKQNCKIQKINKFIQNALILQAELRQMQQEEKKTKISKIRQKIQFNVSHICSLQQIIETKQIQQTDQLLIALKQDSRDQAIRLGQLIEKYSELKSIQIRGDKVKIREKSWQKLLNYFSNLTKLRQMRLTVKGEDVEEVGKVFLKWVVKLRPIDRFHLKINDCKNLNIYWVYTICNCFDLSGLWITLTRCNLNFSKCTELINKLKISTRLSNLPLTDWHMNLSINKIQGNQRQELQNQFEYRSRLINKKSFQV